MEKNILPQRLKFPHLKNGVDLYWTSVVSVCPRSVVHSSWACFLNFPDGLSCWSGLGLEWRRSVFSGVGKRMVSQGKQLGYACRNLNLEGCDSETENPWYRFMAKAERTVINVGLSIFRMALDPFPSEVWLFSFLVHPIFFQINSLCLYLSLPPLISHFSINLARDHFGDLKHLTITKNHKTFIC